MDGRQVEPVLSDDAAVSDQIVRISWKCVGCGEISPYRDTLLESHVMSVLDDCHAHNVIPVFALRSDLEATRHWGPNGPRTLV